MPTIQELRYWQAQPLSAKIERTKETIRNWVNAFRKFTVLNVKTGKERFVVCDRAEIWSKISCDEDIIEEDHGVYVSFSGGKDSTVLLHIVRQMYPDIEAVFVNTGLEYPEIQSFVKSFGNVTILRPKMRFDEVIRKYGYPFISKTVSHNVRILRNCPNGNVAKNIFNPNKVGRYAMHRWRDLAFVDFLISEKCCNIMKKAPALAYDKNILKPFLGTMACESKVREDLWLHNGCNAFNISSPHSAPLSFWTEQDILRYVKLNDLPLASVYGEVVYVDKYKFQYENFLCECGCSLRTTECSRTGCIFCGFGAHLEKGESRFERLKRTHPRQYDYCMGGGAYDTDGLWKPTKEGLGMAHCIDELNRLYGKDFIRY